jgi:acyl-CoA thioesterase FadM
MAVIRYRIKINSGSAPMESAATYRGTVYPWQCDHVGHMNIMWYVGKFDEARTAAKLLVFPETAEA